MYVICNTSTFFIFFYLVNLWSLVGKKFIAEVYKYDDWKLRSRGGDNFFLTSDRTCSEAKVIYPKKAAVHC